MSNDRAGELNYGSTSASAILSFFQALGDGEHLVSLGIEGGVGQVGFNVEDIDLADGTETFVREKALYPTLGAGVAWFCQHSESSIPR